ncbi:MAG: 1-deoxy-D-xylulose-5-phosphate synthase, partial [Planctomycetales bacterium]
ICPRVGGWADYLDGLRLTPWYTGLKLGVQQRLHGMPDFIGQPTEKFLAAIKDSMKAGLVGGMLFEELGFRYFGPIDGHSLPDLKKYFALVKEIDDPVLLHVVTEKGHGFEPAEEDPVAFHAPAPFKRCDGELIPLSTKKSRAYTHAVSEAIYKRMETDPKVTIMTAAMCQGNALGKIREIFPERFFDVGICESHAVAFAAGQAKAGLRPIVDIYSTFLQRGFDQIFQEVSLQNLPVTFLLDRAGLTGPDGPTHHGVFDFGYLRIFPNLVVMAPGDEADVEPMLDFALQHDSPVSIRYPKAKAETWEREPAPLEFGRAEVFDWGGDGMIIACGTLLGDCLRAAEQLRKEGLDVGVINARFVKPLDEETIHRAVRESGFVLTVEEAALAGGFGSAVLESACD